MLKKDSSFVEASLVLLVIFATLAYFVIFVQMSALIAILIVLMVLTGYVYRKDCSFDAIHKGMVEGIRPGIIPIVIFILVGALIAVWIQAGIIPTLMVYGFQTLRIEWFVPSIFIVCAVIGSAFTVMSTIGIALFGVGVTLGLSPALVVGAIVSGAVFGDKMSPLSESTNLAAAVVEVDLFLHIKHLLWSTVPAFFISLILFLFLGHTNAAASLTTIDQTVQLLKENFFISPWSLLPILVMFLCAWKKIPVITTILLNIVVGSAMYFIQVKAVLFKQLATLMNEGYQSHTGNVEVDILLTRVGIESMLPTIALIILALSLGGVLIETNLIATVLNRLSPLFQKPVSLIFFTLTASIGVNIFIGEQFLSVILPGNALKEVYAKKKLAPVVLSRTLEDGGTVINYLVPWGIAGSFVATTFGVPVLTYAPFAFFSLLSPLFSMVSAMTGIGVSYQERECINE
ncbi:MAG: Na+/H+ antiporter NhaC family protein [Enterococcus italicus]|uniref:Na+/H+ antiporter NhaC family protein n=1 Tax=Enterococcus italicus TaxID=246144 RepID=UPI0039965285